MANNHDLFQQYNEEVSIRGKKKARMAASKTALRNQIKKHFEDYHPGYIPQFYIQGSYKMKTAIRTKDDICDVDDGVYFFRYPNVTTKTLQTWICEAVKNQTETSPQHREKCIRVIYAGDYEIDLPVYYSDDKVVFHIATKSNNWQPDDPREMVAWFKSKKDNDGHLINMVKLLKAWCDYKQNAMPSGLAMTILATNAKENIVYNERDDINLRDCLLEIKKAVTLSFICKAPATPYDDLFINYDNTRKTNFLTALNEFVEDANKAIRETNILNASKLWCKHLGNRFPLGDDKADDSIYSPLLVAGIKNSKPYGT